MQYRPPPPLVVKFKYAISASTSTWGKIKMMCTLLTFSLPAPESAQILYMQLTLPPIYYIWTLRLLQLLLTWKNYYMLTLRKLWLFLAWKNTTSGFCNYCEYCLKKKYYILTLQLLWLLLVWKKYCIWTLQLLTSLKQENRARIAIWADGGCWSNVINRVWT